MEKKAKSVHFLGTAIIPARAERFVVRDHFVVDTSDQARVKISNLGLDFEINFLDKIEEPSAEITLCRGKLLGPLSGQLIIDELGGKEKAITTLAAAFALMTKQANGEPGELFIDHSTNIFIVPDKAGVLWEVTFNWLHGGWDVDAFSLIYGWLHCDQIFGLNSILRKF